MFIIRGGVCTFGHRFFHGQENAISFPFMPISSEEKGISSEVIAISSEEIGFPSEEKGISSEEMKKQGKKWVFLTEKRTKKSVYFFGRKGHFFRSYCYFFRRKGHFFRRKGHFFRIWGTKKREEIYKYIYFILHLRHQRVRTCACIVRVRIRA